MVVPLRGDETLIIVLVKTKVFRSRCLNITILILNTAWSTEGSSSMTIPDLNK